MRIDVTLRLAGIQFSPYLVKQLPLLEKHSLIITNKPQQSEQNTNANVKTGDVVYATISVEVD